MCLESSYEDMTEKFKLYCQRVHTVTIIPVSLTEFDRALADPDFEIHQLDQGFSKWGARTPGGARDPFRGCAEER